MKFLGVNITEFTKEKVLEQTRNFFADGKQHMIFTPNPEMIVKAQGDEYFKQVLNAGDINVCDGFGLWLALRLSFRANPPAGGGVEESLLVPQTKDSSARPSASVGMTIERVTGVDLILDLCKQAVELGKSIYLLGSGFDTVVKGVVKNLQEQFSSLQIVGSDKGPELRENVDGTLYVDPVGQERVLRDIQNTKPDMLFVAFGMGKQEKWIYENLARLPSVKVAMGVGGSFDYISGVIPRAPLLLRKMGLEWLYRLIKQPQRIGRILNATLRFVWLVLTK